MNRSLRFALASLFVGLTALAGGLPQAHAAALVTRTYPWHSDQLTIDVPADVQYHPAPEWHLAISAPARTLRKLEVTDGRIRAKPHACFSLIPFCIHFGSHVEDTVQVSISGPALRVVQVNGAAKVWLNEVHQDRLSLRIDGSAKVHGSGSVERLAVSINGAGTVHLGRLSEKRARVHIAGSGTVSIAPTESVSVRIYGAGNVRLHSNPAHVVSRIYGAGEVTRVSATG